MHGYAGFLIVDGARVLCRPGARLSMPRNLDIPYPISSQRFGALNYADGLRYPVLQIPAIPMETATAPWFTAANLNTWFHTRGAGPAYDLAELGSDLVFSDNGVVSGPGLGTFKVTKVKGAGYTINFRKGQPLGFTMRFAGRTRVASPTGNPTAGLDGTPLNFARVALGGGFANIGIAGGSLSFDTGLTPNPELDGTNNPKEHNADLPNGSLSLEVVSRTDVDIPGFDNANLDTYSEITGGIIGVKTVSGVSPSWIFFTVGRATIRDPDDRAQQQGRIMRTFQYDLFATTTAGLLVVSQSASAPV